MGIGIEKDDIDSLLDDMKDLGYPVSVTLLGLPIGSTYSVVNEKLIETIKRGMVEPGDDPPKMFAPADCTLTIVAGAPGYLEYIRNGIEVEEDDMYLNIILSLNRGRYENTDDIKRQDYKVAPPPETEYPDIEL